jgi:hypothetical protein
MNTAFSFYYHNAYFPGLNILDDSFRQEYLFFLDIFFTTGLP